MEPNPFEELAQQGADRATTFERCGFVWIKKSEAVELQEKMALAVCEATREHMQADPEVSPRDDIQEGFGPKCLEDIAWRAKVLLEGRTE